MAKGKSKVAAGGKRAAAGRSKTAGTGRRRNATDGGRGGRKATGGSRGTQVEGVSAPAESTEERIKEAARKLFTQNGFAATRTRDIANEAGINLALLNYYFRSKQKLFDLVMIENFRHFLSGMAINFQDPTLRMEDRLERIVADYVNFLTKFPDLPLFILNEIRGNPSKIAEQIREEIGPARSQFFKELQQAKMEGKTELDPFHFVANLVGLTVFPFVARPLLQRVTGVNDEQFIRLMEERKKLVPKWIRMMMTMKL
jgi:AcrR family transcriptional regulator